MECVNALEGIRCPGLFMDDMRELMSWLKRGVLVLAPEYRAEYGDDAENKVSYFRAHYARPAETE